MLTTPYYQSWMSLRALRLRGSAGYETILSDLGAISPYWSGHNVLGRGGWDPRAAQFAAYLYDVVKQGANTSLAGLLGAATVKYVGIDPQAADEVVAGQNGFFLRQHDFSVRAREGATRSCRTAWRSRSRTSPPPSASSPAGLQVLGEPHPGPRVRLRAHRPRLRRPGCSDRGHGGARSPRARVEVRHRGARRAQSLAVLLHATSTAQLSSIAPGAWPRVAVNPVLDSVADPATAVQVPPARAVTWRPDLAAATRGRIWARVLLGTNEGHLAVVVNGRPTGTLDLTRPAVLGYQWVQAGSVDLAAGSHTVELRASGQPADVQVIEAAVVDGTSRRGARPSRGASSPGRQLPLAVALCRRDAHGAARRHALAGDRRAYRLGRARAAHRARPARGAHLLHARDGAGAQGDGPEGPVRDPVPWDRQRPGVLPQLLLSHSTSPSVSFRFADTSSSSRVLYFSPELAPITSAIPDWSTVSDVSLSTNSKGLLPGSVAMQGPYSLAGAAAAIHGSLPPGGTSARNARSLVGSQLVGTHATLRGVGDGLLVFTQAYSRSWQLSGAHVHDHTVALGYANGYVISAPSRVASLTYATAGLGRIGTAITVASWLAAAVVVALAVRSRRRRRRGVPPTPGAAP